MGLNSECRWSTGPVPLPPEIRYTTDARSMSRESAGSGSAVRRDPSALVRALGVSFTVSVGIVTLAIQESVLVAGAVVALTALAFLGLIAAAE